VTTHLNKQNNIDLSAATDFIEFLRKTGVNCEQPALSQIRQLQNALCVGMQGNQGQALKIESWGGIGKQLKYDAKHLKLWASGKKK